ncbi:MAG: cyclic pyranopterin monophosphate synthase MoaC [Planctomycetes bacterium]|nr:cyclic pyranopterin monophosphate synthase MoaC [Planctomycetota bacterium]
MTAGRRRKTALRSLTHVATDRAGRAAARMVDVGAKPVTKRSALARARVVFPNGLLARVLAGAGPKGAVEEVARVAGILAAKRTGELVPMCHPLGLDVVAFEFEAVDADVLEIRCSTACRGRTGVEMEAMTGAAIAALTVYDMTKALDPAIRIEGVELLEKRGGKRGPWRRDR